MIGLFLLSILWVFVWSFQSRCVNGGNYALAACTSFSVGILQVYVLSRLLGPDASFAQTLVYCAGGAIGVTAAMRVHALLKPRKAPHAE